MRPKIIRSGLVLSLTISENQNISNHFFSTFMFSHFSFFLFINSSFLFSRKGWVAGSRGWRPHCRVRCTPERSEMTSSVAPRTRKAWGQFGTHEHCRVEGHDQALLRPQRKVEWSAAPRDEGACGQKNDEHANVVEPKNESERL